VCRDIQARAALGERKYGERLRAFNGRNPLQDAYEEALDMANYLKQALVEWEAMKAELERLRAACRQIAELPHSNPSGDTLSGLCPKCVAEKALKGGAS
jgi:hypothetical protein